MSVSFAASDATDPERDVRPDPSPSGGHDRHAFEGVAPGVAGPLLLAVRAGVMSMDPLPIQGAKVHRPLLRDDVLSRERLNDWLEQAAKGRLALVVAEAGFGKTTMLADWSRHTARATAWYRLEPDDRDWLTFIRHVVGSGREIDPTFAGDTFALLLQLGPGGPTQADLVASLVRELAEFGAARPNGFTLIFDDYHAIDGSEETDPIVRAILERTGPGFSVVIATRAAPKLPLSRLRSRGGVARLEGGSLCFGTAEADRLFRDAYHQPLEPDVLADLVDRTEGWPALLSLVRTSLEERGSASAATLVAELSGAAGDVYDFLAEEVVDMLPDELSSFLVRVSVLDEVDVEAARLVVDLSDRRIAELIAAADDLRLFVHPDAESTPHLLPLLREFLAARLAAQIGAPAVRDMHRALGDYFRGNRWRAAARHFDRAGDSGAAAAVIEESLDGILGRGEYRAALDLLASRSGRHAVQEVLKSRLLLQDGALEEAVAAARRAVTSAGEESYAHVHLTHLNAASIAIAGRQYEDALMFAARARSEATDEMSRQLAEGYETLLAASVSASLPSAAIQFQDLLAGQVRARQWHYAAITSLNLAQVLVWLDRTPEALQAAAAAERHLERSSRGYEVVSVNLVRAQARAHVGSWAEAERLLGIALDTSHPEGQLEAILEAASIAAWYGPPGSSAGILALARRNTLPTDWALHWKIVDIWLETDQGDCLGLLSELPDLPPHSAEVGAAFRWHLTIARAHLRAGRMREFTNSVSRAAAIAELQRSPLQARLALLLHGIAAGGDSLSRLVARWSADDVATLGVFASELCGALDCFSDAAVMILRRAGRAQPHRWLAPLRNLVAATPDRRAMAAASLLEQIGTTEDISLLREFSRRARRSGRAWGDELIHRVAPRVQVDDLGLMSMAVGERVIDGRSVRRKVLALLAFLAAQPSGSATPDQILDALWPDLDPEQGANSIHQTTYFLRRVLDPSYRAGLSPEYLHFDTEVIWLDRSLVNCQSWVLRRMLDERPTDARAIEALIECYGGRFAVDFAYEDWAAQHRDGLHARFLAVLERAVAGEIGSGDPHWRLWVGQQALSLDPEADAIEAHVIRLYRIVGAPSAAAEQYAHYSAVMSEQLGLEVPDLEDL